MRTYSIVGMNHRKSEEFVAALQPGAEATLVREPSNPFDPNAIAVWIDGKHVGYIPKKQNVTLAAFIDLNAKQMFQMATDEIGGMKVAKSIPAIFIRSPNSKYPMVEVKE